MERSITILFHHAIENTGANTSIYTRSTIRRLDVILSSIQWLSCILIGGTFYGMVYAVLYTIEKPWRPATKDCNTAQAVGECFLYRLYVCLFESFTSSLQFESDKLRTSHSHEGKQQTVFHTTNSSLQKTNNNNKQVLSKMLLRNTDHLTQ